MSKLKDAGISTLAKVAFVSSSAHGAASDAERIKALDEELKTTAERPDEAGPRRLSQPERGERFRKIKLSVSGIDIKDRNGPLMHCLTCACVFTKATACAMSLGVVAHQSLRNSLVRLSVTTCSLWTRRCV